MSRVLGAWMHQLRFVWEKTTKMCIADVHVNVGGSDGGNYFWDQVGLIIRFQNYQVQIMWHQERAEQTCQSMSSEQKWLRADWGNQLWKYKGQYRGENKKTSKKYITETNSVNGAFYPVSTFLLCIAYFALHGQQMCFSIPDLSWCYRSGLNARGPTSILLVISLIGTYNLFP